MAKEEIKKLEGEEQEAKTATPETPDKKTDEKPAKEPGKIKSFFVTHKNKIAAGAGVVGAVGVGIIVDRLGIKIGSGKKKGGDEPGDEQTE